MNKKKLWYKNGYEYSIKYLFINNDYSKKIAMYKLIDEKSRDIKGFFNAETEKEKMLEFIEKNKIIRDKRKYKENGLTCLKCCRSNIPMFGSSKVICSTCYFRSYNRKKKIKTQIQNTNAEK